MPGSIDGAPMLKGDAHSGAQQCINAYQTRAGASLPVASYFISKDMVDKMHQMLNNPDAAQRADEIQIIYGVSPVDTTRNTLFFVGAKMAEGTTPAKHVFFSGPAAGEYVYENIHPATAAGGNGYPSTDLSS